MKIYFADVIQNDSNHVQIDQKLRSIIQTHGQIINRPNNREQSNQRQHDYDVQKLEMADVLIAVATKSSTGLGYKLCLAEQLDLPTIVLYQSSLPSIITGSRKLKCAKVNNLAQAKNLIQNFLGEFK